MKKGKLRLDVLDVSCLLAIVSILFTIIPFAEVSELFGRPENIFFAISLGASATMLSLVAMKRDKEDNFIKKILFFSILGLFLGLINLLFFVFSL